VIRVCGVGDVVDLEGIFREIIKFLVGQAIGHQRGLNGIELALGLESAHQRHDQKHFSL